MLSKCINFEMNYNFRDNFLKIHLDNVEAGTFLCNNKSVNKIKIKLYMSISHVSDASLTLGLDLLLEYNEVYVCIIL